MPMPRSGTGSNPWKQHWISETITVLGQKSRRLSQSYSYRNQEEKMLKLEEGDVPGGKEWRIEGRKARITRKELNDTSVMAQRGIWHWMERRIRGTMKTGMKERENVVREKQGYGGRRVLVSVKSGQKTGSQNQ